MIVYTDSREYAEKIFPGLIRWRKISADTSSQEQQIEPLLLRIFPRTRIYRTQSDKHRDWRWALIVERARTSQFDQMVDLIREGASLPDRIICLAGCGEQFHGQKGRPWIAVPGNIHLTVFLKPERNIAHFQAGFPALAAVSVRETIDCIPGLKDRAAIKWVNDILLDQAKVAGFLAHSQAAADVIQSAVLGIGLNVEAQPDITPNGFIPAVTSLCRHVLNPAICRQSVVLEELLTRLHNNFHLLSEGHALQLVEAYRRHSCVLGRQVEIFTDSPGKKEVKIAEGKVLAIGNNLELIIAGREKPIYHGRLSLKK